MHSPEGGFIGRIVEYIDNDHRENCQKFGLIFGIPVVGYRLADGSVLENQQLEPDIKVANDPATVVRGEDTQLRTAVEELLREIDRK